MRNANDVQTERRGRKFLEYSAEDDATTVKAVEDGQLSQRQACKQYKIPCSTFAKLVYGNIWWADGVLQRGVVGFPNNIILLSGFLDLSFATRDPNPIEVALSDHRNVFSKEACEDSPITSSCCPLSWTCPEPDRGGAVSEQVFGVRWRQWGVANIVHQVAHK